MKTRRVESRPARLSYRPVVEALEQRFVFSVTNPLGLGGLTQFESLEEYRNYFFDIESIVEQHRYVLGRTYLYGYGWADRADRSVALAPAFGASAATASAADFSGTNIQEAGVDEADLVETDGEYLYLVQGSELVIVDASPDDLSVVSRTYVGGWGTGEFLHDDRLTVITCDYTWLATGSWQPQVQVTVFDVSSASAPTMIEQTVLDGSYVTSRAVGDHVYVAVQNNLQPPSPSNHWHGDGFTYQTEPEYRARLAAWVETSGLPGFQSVAADGSVNSGVLNEATEIYRPQVAGERQLVSLVAFDAGDAEAGPTDAITFTVSGTTVYASINNFYLVSPHSDWSSIYKIAMNGDDLELAATGQVRGHVLNQFSMDEQDGYFRIATNDWEGSHLYVLEDRAGALTVVGSLENIAPWEQLYSVRFLRDHAFLVTFQQIDPLFTVDLSDPTNPHLLGELEVPGFSTYLHPIDSNHLLAIGREGNWWSGWELQVSLFNVTDMSNPVLIDRYSIDVGNGWGWGGSGWSWGGSEAEWDHHAFSYFAEDGVLAIPVTVSTWGSEWWDYSETNDLWVLKVDVGAGFTLLDRIEHSGYVYRSLRINDMLYSIGWDGIQVRNLDAMIDNARRAALAGAPDLVSALFGSGVGNGMFQGEEELGSSESQASDDAVSIDSGSDALGNPDFSEDVPDLDSPESADLESLEASIDDLFSTEVDDLLALALG